MSAHYLILSKYQEHLLVIFMPNPTKIFFLTEPSIKSKIFVTSLPQAVKTSSCISTQFVLKLNSK